MMCRSRLDITTIVLLLLALVAIAVAQVDEPDEPIELPAPAPVPVSAAQPDDEELSRVRTSDYEHPEGLSRTLEFVVLVHRHGDRTPIEYWQPDWSVPDWRDGPGQLTPRGMNQLYELGEKLRSRYITGMGFLSPTYDRHEITVRSSDYDRTLMSAQSLLMAMYPEGTGPNLDAEPALPHAFQPIPIHTIPKDDDYLLRSHDLCDKYKQLVDQVHLTPEWIAKDNENEPFLKRLGQYFSADIKLSNLDHYNDMLVCEKAHDIVDPRGVPREMMDESEQLYNWVNSRHFQSGEVGKYAGGHLLWRIRQDIQEFIKDSSFKFKHYSAHDNTVSSLLAAMGEFVTAKPPYGSAVIFEVWAPKQLPANTTREESLRLRIIYNDVIKHTIACESDFCPLVSWLEELENFSIEDPRTECATTTTSEQVSQLVYVIGIGAAVLVVVVSVAVVACLLQKRIRAFQKRYDSAPNEAHPVEMQSV